jgi:septal ring-binding cell division protein DamX
VSGTWNHVHAWLDADTWHWAMVEVGAVILLILFICIIAALVRGGGSSSRSEQAHYQAASRELRDLSRQTHENIDRIARDWKSGH